MVVLVVLCAFLVLHAYRPGRGIGEVLRGSALQLVDAKGIVRAQIDVEAQGDVVLRLRDDTGTIRVKIGASEQGSGIVLLNDSTEVGVHLLANSTGSSVTVQAKGGKKKRLEP